MIRPKLLCSRYHHMHKSCTLPFFPPRHSLDLAQIYTDASFLALVSRWDRLLVFGACNVAALACFVLCFALFPILWPVPRKFAILFVYPVHLLILAAKGRVSAPLFYTHPLLPEARRMRLHLGRGSRSSFRFDCVLCFK